MNRNQLIRKTLRSLALLALGSAVASIVVVLVAIPLGTILALGCLVGLVLPERVGVPIIEAWTNIRLNVVKGFIHQAMNGGVKR